MNPAHAGAEKNIKNAVWVFYHQMTKLSLKLKFHRFVQLPRMPLNSLRIFTTHPKSNNACIQSKVSALKKLLRRIQSKTIKFSSIYHEMEWF